MTAPRLIRPHAAPAAITIRLVPFERWLPQLARAVAAVCEISTAELVQRRSRMPRIKRARYAFILAARETLGRSYIEIAEALQCRCHSSMTAGHRIALKWRASDPEFCQLTDLVNAIAAQLRNPAPVQLEIQQEMFHDAQAA